MKAVDVYLALLPWYERIAHPSNWARIKNSGLELDRYGTEFMLKGWRDWEKLFRGLAGKTVLNAGACCGETAYYFLTHGARKVIAIECDTGVGLLLEHGSAVFDDRVDHGK